MKDENGNWIMATGNHEPVTAGRVEKCQKSKRNTIDPQIFWTATAQMPLACSFCLIPHLIEIWNGQKQD